MLTGGFIAGVCDITYACTFHGIKSGASPVRICQSVAAGLLGRTASFQGGLPTAALGLALHFFIALSMALTYYAVARKWPLLWKQWFPCGAFYGLLLYGIMNYIVIPMSRTTAGSKDPLWVVLSILVHMFLIGAPIAYFVRRALPIRSEIALPQTTSTSANHIETLSDGPTQSRNLSETAPREVETARRPPNGTEDPRKSSFFSLLIKPPKS